MPRSKSAAKDAAKPPEAPPSFAVAAVAGPPHHRVASALLAVVAALPVEVALTKLADQWRVMPDGTGRRAIRAAAITLLRRDVPVRAAPPPMPDVVLPEPEPDPAPAPRTPPAPSPKTGALTTLALEDAARMLMSAQEEEAAPPPIPADALAALMSLDSAADPETPDADGEGSFRPLPAPPALDGMAALLDADDTPAVAKPKRSRKPKVKGPSTGAAEAAAIDLDAAFAILSDVEDVTLPAPKPALDLSAQFAAMEGDGD